MYDNELRAIDTPETRWPDSTDRLSAVRFIGQHPEKFVSSLSVDSIAHLREMSPRLNDRVVLIGMQSFAGIDEFVTPIGTLPGTLVHAHVVNTTDMRIRKSIESAFPLLADVVLGILTVIVLSTLHRISAAPLISSVSPNLSALAELLGPLLGFVFFALLTLWACAGLYSVGLWCDPLPMLVGLALHVYAGHRTASVQPKRGGDHPPHGLEAWCKQTLFAWKSLLRWGRHRPRFDDGVVAVGRLVMVGTVVAAIWVSVGHG